MHIERILVALSASTSWDIQSTEARRILPVRNSIASIARRCTWIRIEWAETALSTHTNTHALESHRPTPLPNRN